MSSQTIQIVILAGVALFLVLQLRKVLGTRDGFEPPTKIEPAGGRPKSFEVIDGGGEDHDIAHFIGVDTSDGRALAAMKRVEPNFTVSDFASGAKYAYELILMAFENGEMDEVKDFVSDEIYESFNGAVMARKEKGLNIEATFVGVSKTELMEATFDEETSQAEITMRFSGELTSVVKNASGDIVEGDPKAVKRQRDTWTFARGMGVDDPNWQLVATEQ